MAGIPGVLISSVLTGAADRMHEWQQKEFADAQTRRSEILKFYGDAYDRLSQDPQYDPIRLDLQKEIGKVSQMDPGKLMGYTVKSDFAAPPHLTEKAPVTPPIDLGHVVHVASTGQMPPDLAGAAAMGTTGGTAGGTAGAGAPSGAPSAGAGAGAQTAGGPPVTPPPMGMPPAGPSGPQMGAQMGAQMGPFVGGVPSITPPSMPAVAQHANNSVPEASPMTGMPVGAPAPPMTPTPVLAAASMGMPAGATSDAGGAGGAGGAQPMTPTPMAAASVDRGPFPGSGEIERQKLVAQNQALIERYQALRRMGMTPQGKMLADPVKMTQMGKVYDPEDPSSDAFGYRNARPEELTPQFQLTQRKADAYVKAQEAKSTLDVMSARYKQSAMTPGSPLYDLHRMTVEMQLQRLNAYLRFSELRESRQQSQFERDTWGTVGGQPVPGAMISPDTGEPLGFKAPQLQALRPTEYSKSNAEQGRSVIESGNALIAEINNNKDALGAWDGRVNLARKDLGISDPAVRRIFTDLKSYAALQPKLHGARGVQYQHEFEDAIGTLKENPDAVVASVNGLNALAGRFVARIGDVKYAGTKPATPGGFTDQTDPLIDKRSSKTGPDIGWSNKQRTWVDAKTHQPIGKTQ